MFDKILFESQKQSAFAFEFLRFVNFTVQQKTLPIMNFLATGQNIRMSQEEKAKLPITLQRHIEILQKDAERIAEGVYPFEVLRPESIVSHFKRLPFLYKEGFEIARRRNKNDAKNLAPKQNNISMMCQIIFVVIFTFRAMAIYQKNLQSSMSIRSRFSLPALRTRCEGFCCLF